ncbi:hypothetical protein EST62_07740 [Chlorobaculum sp. 24CR]|jgi:hypothetical protein|uniref:hypothetical protein n=1 Tax=Chlorobaculum sp. 24CR TaxID=2508878 RepID=UPI00100ABAF5|nr:hypothetical protein [Chlorobaculum sp. 24CR]RXK85088.1 hypothetical protein EST62_07740 [Chlorobaculum sp. 24CR]
MNGRKVKKLLHEGKYAAEIEIELIDSEEGWAPYISLEDALKLDQVRAALRSGDVATALRYGKVYKLSPVAA